MDLLPVAHLGALSQVSERCSASGNAPPLRAGAAGAYTLSDGVVYRTYVTTARGLEPAMGYYALLDRTPMGRNEEDDTRPFWLRRHDEY